MKQTRIEVFAPNEQYPFNGITTLALAPSGELLLAWYAGSWEGHWDNVILMARSRDEGLSWSSPEVIHDTPGRPDRDPEIAFIGKTLYLWCNSCIFITQTASLDEGHTWGEPVEVGGFAAENVASCEPFRLSSGRLCFPASYIPEYKPTTNYYRPAVLLSDDEARVWRWHTIPMPEGVEGLEPTVVELGDHSLLALMRAPGGWAYESWSYDGGLTWSLAVASTLPNPGSNHDLLRLANGELSYWYNPSPKGRTPLAVAFGRDGRSWSEPLVLDDSEGECGYPTAFEAFGKLYCAYHYKKESIRLVILER